MTERQQAIFTVGPHDRRACVDRVLRAADSLNRTGNVRFTPVRRRALEILLERRSAVSAYELLERLKADGFGAGPPVAYRALAFLVVHGFVHRVESLNAFVACTGLHDDDHDPVLMICRSCRAVAETCADTLRDMLGQGAREIRFEIESAVVELEGLCSDCQRRPRGGEVPC